MAADVVVAAQRGTVDHGGDAAFAIEGDVIHVAVGGRHAATGKDAGAVPGGDGPALGCGVPAATGHTGVDDLTAVRIGDGVPPLGVARLFGDATGDVGDDRAVAGEVAGVVVEAGERRQVDLDVHHAPVAGTSCLTGALESGTGEEVEKDVGAELVHGAGLAVATQASGEAIDVTHCGNGLVGGEVISGQRGRAVDSGAHGEAALGDGRLVSLLGPVRPGGDS